MMKMFFISISFFCENYKNVFDEQIFLKMSQSFHIGQIRYFKS